MQYFLQYNRMEWNFILLHGTNSIYSKLYCEQALRITKEIYLGMDNRSGSLEILYSYKLGSYAISLNSLL